MIDVVKRFPVLVTKVLIDTAVCELHGVKTLFLLKQRIDCMT